MKRYTKRQFIFECVQRYGANRSHWRFECPSCHMKQSANDLINAGVGETFNEVFKYLGYWCVGNWSKKQGCEYSNDMFLNIFHTDHLIEIEYKNKKTGKIETRIFFGFA